MNIKEEIELSKKPARGLRAKIVGNLQNESFGGMRENYEISEKSRNYDGDFERRIRETFIMPLEESSIETVKAPMSTNYKDEILNKLDEILERVSAIETTLKNQSF